MELQKFIGKGGGRRSILLPTRLLSAWDCLARNAKKNIADLANDSKIAQALICLAATADEASVGFGLDSDDPACWLALTYLSKHTLTFDVDASKLRVLPKQHTPGTGLTLRSLTHHICLHVGNDVVPMWYNPPAPIINTSRSDQPLNVLVCPWPFEIDSQQFFEVKCNGDTLPRQFGYMGYKHNGTPKGGGVGKWLRRAIAECEKRGQDIGIAVFPESALNDDQFDEVRRIAR